MYLCRFVVIFSFFFEVVVCFGRFASAKLFGFLNQHFLDSTMMWGNAGRFKKRKSRHTNTSSSCSSSSQEDAEDEEDEEPAQQEVCAIAITRRSPSFGVEHVPIADVASRTITDISKARDISAVTNANLNNRDISTIIIRESSAARKSYF